MTRPTIAKINLKNLLKNCKQLQKRGKLMPIVKADAYGHGAVAVSHALEKAGIGNLGVALVEEGIELRQSGIKSDIIVLFGPGEGEVDETGVPITLKSTVKELIKHRLTPTIFDAKIAKSLDKILTSLRKNLHVHIKIDTGMGRLGIRSSDYEDFLNQIEKYKSIKITGICSHLADAEGADPTYTLKQKKEFEEAIKKTREKYPYLKSHIANSMASVSFDNFQYDLIRPGIMLYGVMPSYEVYTDWRKLKNPRIEIKPALELKTKIVFIKEVPKGTSISYGRTFTTKRPSRIATIPIGYADGYPRLLSNKGQVLIKGKRAPVVGRVCMDLTMIDITGVKGAKVGDEVTLIGTQGQSRLPVEELSHQAQTIPYEILTGITKRVPRVYE